MNSTKPMNIRFQNILIIVSLFLVLIAYLFLQPHISNVLPFIRQHRLNSLINNSIKNKAISAQEFWEFREFYAPGTIKIDRPSMTFKSNRITSIETLVNSKSTLKAFVKRSDKWNILFENETNLIAQEDSSTYIYFIKPISEMSRANGFFDYKDKDKKMLENKKWYVYTKVSK